MADKYLSVDDYINLPVAPTQYLIDCLIPQPGRILLIGPPKRGKSYLALQIGLAVAKGEPFLGRPGIPGGRRVIYLQFDMPSSQWRERMEKLKEEDITFPPYCMDGSQGDFLLLGPTFQKPRLDILENPQDVTYLEDIMREQHPALVIVDTLAKLHTGDENSERSMKAVFHKLNDIFGECAILYIHHTRKLSPPPGQKVYSRPTPSDAARGSSFIGGEVDAIWLLFNHCLTTEVRFDEDGSYPCEQDPHTHLWKFKEPDLIAAKEVSIRKDWASREWASWKAFRHYIAERYPHLPTHLVNRLRRELEPIASTSALHPHNSSGPLCNPTPAESQSPDTPSLHPASS